MHYLFMLNAFMALRLYFERRYISSGDILTFHSFNYEVYQTEFNPQRVYPGSRDEERAHAHGDLSRCSGKSKY